MSSLCFYITENLRKNINQNQLDAIQLACQSTSTTLNSNSLNTEIISSIKKDTEYFILSDAIDFVFFVTKARNLIGSNFIIMPNDKDLSLFEKYKEEMKDIRYLIGIIHIDLLKTILVQIITYKLNTSKPLIDNLNFSNPTTFSHKVMHSSERSELQSKVTDFFQSEIQKNKDKLVAGSNSYSKILGDIVDEFLMNAIWDACPTRNNIDRTIPVALKDEESIELNCFFEGVSFVMSVCDKFGTFQGDGITKYIRFGVGYKETEAVKEGTPGAGLGIFMILQKIGVLVFEVEKGKLTRAIAIARGDQSIRDVQKKPKTVLFFEK